VVGHQGIIVAGDHPLKVSHGALFEMEQSARVKATLAEHRLADYARAIVLDERGIDAFVADVADEHGLPTSALLSTDENLFLEYATPRGNVPTADDIPNTLAYLSTYRQSDLLRAHVAP
jgi:spermidine synthase